MSVAFSDSENDDTLVLNLVIGWKTLQAERVGGAPPPWLKPLIYLAIPWAISIHTVTAFLYSGLYAFGALILTVLYKIAITVKKETGVIG